MLVIGKPSGSEGYFEEMSRPAGLPELPQALLVIPDSGKVCGGRSKYSIEISLPADGPKEKDARERRK